MHIQVQFCNGVTIFFVSLWGHNPSFFRLNTYFLGKVFDYFRAFFFMYLLSPLLFSLFPYTGLKYKFKDKKSSILPNQFCIALRNQAKIFVSWERRFRKYLQLVWNRIPVVVINNAR
jgi:hypothetical protein